jgi:hypothetical protein
MFNGALCFRPPIVRTIEVCGRVAVGLLSSASSTSDCIAQNAWVINVLDAFQCRVLSRHLPGGTNYFSHDIRFSSRDSNPIPSEYRAGIANCSTVVFGIHVHTYKQFVYSSL